MAVALLPGALIGGLLIVEAAWGANLTDLTGASWTWTDITSYVRLDPGIDTALGRADEASTTQPANCTLILDNADGRFSLGPQNTINYPYVRRGTPIRVRVQPSTGAGYTVVFQGGAVSWMPDWTLKGTAARVALTVSGTLRRLGQGASPVVSPYRRSVVQNGTATAYWPCEEPVGAQSFASAVGGTAMSWSGQPTLAADDSLPSSAALPQLKGAVFYGDVPAVNGFTQSVTTVMFELPQVPVDGSILFRTFYNDDNYSFFDVVYGLGGTLTGKLYDRFGTLLSTSGAVAFNVSGQVIISSTLVAVPGSPVLTYMNALQIGASQDVGSGGTSTVNVNPSRSVCSARKVVINPGRTLTDTAVGHILVQPTYTLSNLIQASSGYAGEFANNRVTRVCSENGIPLIVNSSAGAASSSDFNGPQPEGNVLTVLRAAEKADLGTLYDGISAGLVYVTRRFKEDQAAVLTIDASLLQLAPPFSVVDDDQRTRNKAVVSNTSGGAESVFTDVTGPMGTNVIGTYDTSEQVNYQLDDACFNYAAWLVSQGTIVGYRYPSVSVDLAATPTLAAAWLLVKPGTRIDIVNLPSVLPGHPAGTLSLMVEGVANHFGPNEWSGVAQCSPYQVWNVAQYADTLISSDTVWTLRADTSGSTVNTAAALGATSLSVATPSGPLWSTSAGDYPLSLDVAGQKVTATACSGASSPQTFTVAALPAAVPSGAAVALYQPAVIGV